MNKVPVYEKKGDKKIRLFGSCQPDGDNISGLKDYRNVGIDSIALYVNNDEYYRQIGGKSLADHRVNKDVKKWDEFIKNCIDADLDVFIRGLNEHYFDDFDYDYNKFDEVKGLYVWDEPGYNIFKEKIADVLVPWYNEHYSDKKIWYINLYPSYAYTGRSLGTEADNSYPGYTTYEKYIYAYVDIVLNNVKGKKILSIDHYPLRITEERGAFLSYTWLFDLMVGKMGAIRANCPFACCIQCYDNAEKCGIRSIRSKADMDFQVYTSLAFGATGLEYYQYGAWYNSEGDWDGLVDAKWNIRPPYYYVQKLNEELRRFEHVLLSFDWQGVYCSYGKESSVRCESFDELDKITDTRKLKSLNNVKKVSSKYDAIIGQFVDKEGRNGYMIVNFTEPTEKKINDVKLKIEKYTKALLFRNGIQSEIEIKNGEFDISLNEGEGVYLILY